MDGTPFCVILISTTGGLHWLPTRAVSSASACLASAAAFAMPKRPPCTAPRPACTAADAASSAFWRTGAGPSYRVGFVFAPPTAPAAVAGRAASATACSSASFANDCRRFRSARRAALPAASFWASDSSSLTPPFPFFFPFFSFFSFSIAISFSSSFILASKRFSSSSSPAVRCPSAAAPRPRRRRLPIAGLRRIGIDAERPRPGAASGAATDWLRGAVSLPAPPLAVKMCPNLLVVAGGGVADGLSGSVGPLPPLETPPGAPPASTVLGARRGRARLADRRERDNGPLGRARMRSHRRLERLAPDVEEVSAHELL